MTSRLRMLPGLTAALLPVALLPASAAAQGPGTGAQVAAADVASAPPAPPAYTVTATGAVVEWGIVRKRPIRRLSSVMKVQPCLRLQYRRSSTDICLTDRRGVQVRHSGYSGTYRLPVRIGKTPETFRIRLQAADLMLRPGQPRAMTTCLARGCGRRWDPPRSSGRVLVPVRVLQQCTGRPGKVREWPAAGKAVALTFDDGPSDRTRAVLSQLRRGGVPGTFFTVGTSASGQRQLLRQLRRQGHVLGNHTYHHADLARLSDSAAAGEISAANRLIRSATGFQPCLFRAPYGTETQRVVDVASGLGMTTVGWSVDPSDWKRPGAAAIADRVVSATRPGSIILLHDGGGADFGTPAALGPIIKRLRDRGYRFVTVPELLNLPRSYR